MSCNSTQGTSRSTGEHSDGIDTPVVAVIMCTYNGEQHLHAQLTTLAQQDWPIALRVFDDASTDSTVELLENDNRFNDYNVHRNERNVGYVANFENAVRSALEEGFEYIALCDQDDLWQPNRVSEGMQTMLAMESELGNSMPLLCHSDLSMIDSKESTVHESFFQYRQYTVSNIKSLPTALGQSGVMGNTILMNKSLAEHALPFPEKLHVHDYWFGLIAELFGQRAMINEPLVKYRIHGGNASNSVDSIRFGLNKHLEHKSWTGFIERDYRLPFKEDTRVHAVNSLLNSNDKWPALSQEQVKTITLFRDYLEFKTSRFTLLIRMLKAGFFKRGLRHRIRLIYSVLLTNRYS